MSPHLASFVFLVGTLGLFWLDRDPKLRTSPALWLPIMWLSVGASRSVSVWLGSSGPVSADEYLDGSPLDRALLTGILVLAIIVVASRGERTSAVLKRNAPLAVFFLYCMASTFWSDFPIVAFKRWTKVLGNVVMVLVVMTEDDPAFSLKRFLTWTGYILIPASVLIIKYYPYLGRYYDKWEGTAYYSGVTTDKNLMGCTCLVLGLGIVLRFVETFHEKKYRWRRLLAVGSVLGMNLWLFQMINSATSLGCFIVGSTIIVVLGLFRVPRPSVAHLMVGSLIGVGFVAYFFPSTYAYIVHSAGRNTNLTGRTDLWVDLLGLAKHPWFGTGFESFFLGPRLEYLWGKYWWHPNEAHNGFLETYLTLGIFGLSLLGLLILTGYRNAIAAYCADPRAGSLRLAFVVVAPIYNLTEAAFKIMNPVWILFLLSVASVPTEVWPGRGVAEPLPGRSPELPSSPEKVSVRPEPIPAWRPRRTA